MPRILIKLAAIASLGVAAQAAACTIEKATYAYSVDKNITVQFENKGHLDAVSPLVLSVKLGTGKATYWFFFDQGSARYTSLISTTDVNAPQWAPSDETGEHPLGSMKYFSWRSNLHVNEAVPQPGDLAPDFIFLPDLPENLWYVARPRISIAPGIFALKSCS